jgi:hypothetical protein
MTPRLDENRGNRVHVAGGFVLCHAVVLVVVEADQVPDHAVGVTLFVLCTYTGCPRSAPGGGTGATGWACTG